MREVEVPIGWMDTDGRRDGVSWRGVLLPGGALFLALRPARYLQCWNVQRSKCIWTYTPGAPNNARNGHTLKVCKFSYDMQANGDVRALVVSEFAAIEARTLEIFQIGAQTGSETSLYKRKPKDIGKTNEVVYFSKLSGNVSAVHMWDHLVLTFWEEDRSVVIHDRPFDDVDLVDDYLIGVLDIQGSKSIIVILISSIRNIRPRAAISHATPKLMLSDIPYVSCPILPHPHSRILGAGSLSVCTFHWMAEAERKRKGIAIITLLNELGEQHSYSYSVMDSFRLETATDFSSVYKSEVVLPSDSLPCLRHIGHIKSTALTRQSYFNSGASQPSQAGSTAIVTFCFGSLVWSLATVPHEEEMVFRTLNVPNEADVYVEFCSGALYFQTEDRESVVIQYFD